MKFIKLKLCPLMLFIILILAGGCKNTVDSMIDSYNSKYTVNYLDPDGPQPGEGRFFEQNMLLDRYFVCENETLNLCAPKQCRTYEWILTDPNRPEEYRNFATLTQNSSYESQRFVLYVPESGISTGYYNLRLYVTDKEGKRFTDSCVLVIYKNTNDKER